MSMHAAQSAKTIGRHAHTFKVGQLDSARVAHRHVLNVTFAIDQHADLPIGFVRQFAQLSRELGRDDLARTDTSLIQLLNASQLVWFQTVSISVQAPPLAQYHSGWVPESFLSTRVRHCS